MCCALKPEVDLPTSLQDKTVAIAATPALSYAARARRSIPVGGKSSHAEIEPATIARRAGSSQNSMTTERHDMCGIGTGMDVDVIGSDPPAKGVEPAGGEVARRPQDEALLGGRFTKVPRIPASDQESLGEQRRLDERERLRWKEVRRFARGVGRPGVLARHDRPTSGDQTELHTMVAEGPDLAPEEGMRLCRELGDQVDYPHGGFAVGSEVAGQDGSWGESQGGAKLNAFARSSQPTTIATSTILPARNQNIPDLAGAS